MCQGCGCTDGWDDGVEEQEDQWESTEDDVDNE